jgi:hypothetical protein
MRIPNADRAIIAPEKLRDYLLNPSHRRGGGKARLLISLGYQRDGWALLERDLRSQHLSADMHVESMNEYGRRFEILAPIRTPSGKTLVVRSVWQIDRGSQNPRFITLYPG